MADILSQEEIEQLLEVVEDDTEESTEDMVRRVAQTMGHELSREINSLERQLEDLQRRKDTLDILYDYFTGDNQKKDNN